MIGRLSGELILRRPPFLMIDVGGVAYEIEAPLSVFYQLPQLGERASVWIHMLVREDAQLLYGFSDDDSRQLFRTLLKVNGVGAKMALGILSGMSQHEFAVRVADGDTAALTKLPGIGKKTAERLVIEMRDKLAKGLPSASGNTAAASSRAVPVGDVPIFAELEGAFDEATAALVTLGYKATEAEKMVKRVYDEQQPQTTDVLIRYALKLTLGPAKSP